MLADPLFSESPGPNVRRKQDVAVRSIQLPKQAGPGRRRGDGDGRRRRRTRARRWGRSRGDGPCEGRRQRREGDLGRSRRQGVNRQDADGVRRPRRRPLQLRRRGRWHTRHRTDQLHRPSLPDRPDVRCGHVPARIGDWIHLLGGRDGLGGQPAAADGVPEDRGLRRGDGMGEGTRQGRLHVEQAGDLRLRRTHGAAVSQTRRADQRDAARSDRHASGPGECRSLAGLRRRLPEGGERRGIDLARAGLAAGVPLQRRRRGHQRHHAHHRRGICELGHLGVVSVCEDDGELPSRRGRSDRRGERWALSAAQAGGAIGQAGISNADRREARGRGNRGDLPQRKSCDRGEAGRGRRRLPQRHAARHRRGPTRVRQDGLVDQPRPSQALLEAAAEGAGGGARGTPRAADPRSRLSSHDDRSPSAGHPARQRPALPPRVDGQVCLGRRDAGWQGPAG